MVATMDIAGHIADFQGHWVPGVTLKTIKKMTFNVVRPMMTVYAHIKSVGAVVGADSLQLVPFFRTYSTIYIPHSLKYLRIRGCRD